MSLTASFRVSGLDLANPSHLRMMAFDLRTAADCYDAQVDRCRDNPRLADQFRRQVLESRKRADQLDDLADRSGQ